MLYSNVLIWYVMYNNVYLKSIDIYWFITIAIYEMCVIMKLSIDNDDRGTCNNDVSDTTVIQW